MNMFCAGDKHFIGKDKSVKTSVQTSATHRHTHTHTASYLPVLSKLTCMSRWLLLTRYSHVDMTVRHTSSTVNKTSCIMLQILKRSFSVAQIGLLKDHINRQNKRRTFTNTQLSTSNFQTETHSSLLHMRIHMQLLCEKQKKFLNETVLHSGDTFKAVAP